jgi:hypothetical protein
LRIYNCPQCHRAQTPRWSEHRATHSFDWYVCRCRHSWKTICNAAGHDRKVVAESPFKPKSPEWQQPTEVTDKALRAPCPSCHHYGNVKMTFPMRPDGKWRRHKCDACGPYFSCTAEGHTEVFRKMRSTRAQDFGDAA